MFFTKNTLFSKKFSFNPLKSLISGLAQGINGDHAGSEASMGVKISLVFVPVKSTLNNLDRPPLPSGEDLL